MIWKRLIDEKDLEGYLEENQLTLSKDFEPLKYPCVMVICTEGNFIEFDFIYPEDIYFKGGKGLRRD